MRLLIMCGIPFLGIILLFMGHNVLGSILWIGWTIFIIFALIDNFSKQKNKKGELEEELKNMLENVNGLSQIYISKDYNSAIGINESKSEIHLIRNINYDPKIESAGSISIERDYFNYEIKKYSFSDILTSEVIEDDQSIVSTSRGSQIGGALLGGVLAGGVGAIIGGLSGSQTLDKKVKTMKLNIIINDTETPLRTIVFLNEVVHINKFEPKYEMAEQEVKHWHSLISVLIKKADKEDKEREKTEDREFQRELQLTPSIKSSVADELKNLNELVNEGILSEDEFKEQKYKLLAKA